MLSDEIQTLGPETVLAVLGNPIRHSLSPAMHDAGLAALGYPYRYGRLQVTEAELPEAFRRLRCMLRGWNLTLPLKLAAVPLVDEVDEAAGRLGAINTVV